jgi:hypothetical protein
MSPKNKQKVLRIAYEHALAEWRGNNPCWVFDKFEQLVSKENLNYDDAYLVFAIKLNQLNQVKPFVMANI